MLLRHQERSLPCPTANPAGLRLKPLPQTTIDRAIDAKLQRLKIQPSSVVDDAGFLRRVSLLSRATAHFAEARVRRRCVKTKEAP